MEIGTWGRIALKGLLTRTKGVEEDAKSRWEGERSVDVEVIKMKWGGVAV